MSRADPIRQGDIPGVQLRLRRDYPLDPEALWAWLTDPELMPRWLGTVRERSAERLVLETEDSQGNQVCEELQIRLRDRPRTWGLTLRRPDSGWQVATRLTFELTPGSGGCELSVFQQGFEQLKLSTCLTEWERYRRRWRRAFDHLGVAIGRD